jgi:hypothetical protein
MSINKSLKSINKVERRLIPQRQHQKVFVETNHIVNNILSFDAVEIRQPQRQVDILRITTQFICFFPLMLTLFWSAGDPGSFC